MPSYKYNGMIPDDDPRYQEGISIIISLFGTDTASVKFISENFYQKNFSKIKSIYITILKIVIPISVVFSVSIFVFRNFLSHSVLNKPNLEIGIFYIVLAILPMCLIHIHSESLRGMKKVELYAIIKYFM